MAVELDDSERVRQLLGARDLIRECEEMLRGERRQLTAMDEYLRLRLRYWRARYQALDLRRGERRSGLDRRASGRATPGRRSDVDRRSA
jgi:hypothetical protein